MENFIGLLGIRRMAKVPNVRIRDLCGATKGVDEMIDEGVLRWFSHVEGMENDNDQSRAKAGSETKKSKEVSKMSKESGLHKKKRKWSCESG